MPFMEQRTALAAQLAQLEDLLRQAQGISRALEERTQAAADQTESFADDTALAHVAAAAKRARQRGRQTRDVGARQQHSMCRTTCSPRMRRHGRPDEGTTAAV